MEAPVARMLERVLPADRGRLRPADLLMRAAGACTLATATGANVDAVVADSFGGDPLVLRAASASLSIADDPELAAAPRHFVLGLAPLSAAASLFERALRLDLAATGQTIPGVGAAGAAFIAEGAAIPASSLPPAAPAMVRFKIAAMATMTDTLARSSDAPALVADALSRSAAATLDAVLFSAEAATAAQPAGICYGIEPLTGYAGGDFLSLRTDLSALAAAVAPVAAGGFVLIMDPARALRLSLLTPALAVPVLPSAQVAEDVVLAVVPGALAWGADAADVFASNAAVIHEEDETPAANLGSGDPSPIRALWQTASIATRLLLDVGWTLRGPGVAWVEGASW